VPVRVVEMVPVRLPVVEMIPVLVVEMVPALVVEIVPVFANAEADTVITSVTAHTIDLRFLIALLLSVISKSGYMRSGLGIRLLSLSSSRLAKKYRFRGYLFQRLCQKGTSLC